jgi:plasmid stabilization system protein ParE
MRRVVYAHTFERDLLRLVAQGRTRFGDALVEAKATLLLDTVETLLASYPDIGRLEPTLNLLRYSIKKTPFVVLYAATDDELHVYTVVHRRSDIPSTDLSDIEW